MHSYTVLAFAIIFSAASLCWAQNAGKIYTLFYFTQQNRLLIIITKV